MGRCATCGKWIGLFGRKWRKLDWAKHCLQCVPNVMAQRRERTKQSILVAPAPRMIFSAPVVSRDLDYPSNHRRYTGALLLTDKGVIFAQHGEYKKAQEGAALFGLAGAVFDSLVEKGRRERASFGWGDIGDLSAQIDQAEQLFFFPKDDIRKLKCTNGYFELKMQNGSALFRWTEARKSVNPHRFLLDAYVQAVRAGRDVMADCKGLLQR
mgnify:CR=1 FL=1